MVNVKTAGLFLALFKHFAQKMAVKGIMRRTLDMQMMLTYIKRVYKRGGGTAPCRPA